MSKKTKTIYALKCVSRFKIAKWQIQYNLQLEKNILNQLDHPFIMKLIKTFKDEKRVYFLLEYIRGQELFDVIREIGLLNQYECQFYISSMMSAVTYLHERKIIYRYIKPENVMVDDTG